MSYLSSFSRRIPLLVGLCTALFLTVSASAISFDALVTAATVDPQNTDRIYASTGGGLLRTDNRGATWQQLPIFPLGSRQPALTRIEFDMATTATIYGTALGDISNPLVGAWRSVDRGANWQRIIQANTFPEGSELERLLVAPTNGSVLYAVVSRASVETTYRSGDGGATWVKGGTGGADAVSTGNADTLYRGSFGRVYRSTNGAQSWAQIGQTYDADDSLNGINGIAVSPADPNILLATMSGPNSTLNGVFRSTNGGSSWTRVLQTNTIGVYFHPTNGAQAIVGDCCGISIYYSSNSGQTFSDVKREVAGAPDSFSGSVSRTWFDLAQSGRLIQGLASAQGGGIAVVVAPNGVWNKLPGTYTPTAVPDAFLDSGKLLKGDTSQARTVVRIVAAEGSSAPGFTIGAPVNLGTGVSVTISQNGTDPQNPTPTFTVARDAKNLAAGTQTTQLAVPVTGAINAEVRVEGALEVLDTPESAGVFLGRGLPPNQSASVYSLASANNKVYIGSFARIYTLDAAGASTVIAGTGTSGFSGDGGLATNAELSFARSVAAAPDGSVYFHDSSNRRIRRIAPDGKISTFAGDPSKGSTLAEGANLNEVSFLLTPGLAIRPNGEVLVAYSSRIWRVDNGKFRTVAGGGTTQPATGVDADAAVLAGVDAIALDAQGRIVLASSSQLFRIEANGTLRHLAGAAPSQSVPGSQKATEASLNIDAFTLRADRIFLADRNSRTIMRVDPNGDIVRVAFNGMGGTPSSCTGARYAPASSSIFDGLVFGPDGSLFVGLSGLPRFWLPAAGGPTGPAPAITAEGVVNAASFTRELSPGTLASVFGSNLATSDAAASALPLPAQLNGTVVCLAGEVAPLIFTSPLQANSQLPFGLEPGTHALRAFNLNGGSGSVAVNIQETSPGVFESGGRAVVINPNGSLNAPGNGVGAGEAVVVYMTGIGDVTPEGTAGWANPSNPLAVPNVARTATVGGVTAELYYLGMTPGYAGLAQANIKIPALAPGEHQFVLTVGGYSSKPLALTVR